MKGHARRTTSSAKTAMMNRPYPVVLDGVFVSADILVTFMQATQKKRNMLGEVELTQTVFATRLAALRAQLNERYGAFVCTVPENIYWLTKFHTPGDAFMALVVTTTQEHLVVRSLEATNATRPGCNVRCVPYGEAEAGPDVLARVLTNLKVRTVGCELHSKHVSVCEHARLCSLCPRVAFVATPLIVENMRRVKSSQELVCIKRAAQIVRKALRSLAAIATPGVTECHVAGQLSACTHAEGSEYTAYPPFVASGCNGCIGHHAASRKQIRFNELLFVEIAASIQRYHAAKMHTLYIGPAPPAWFVHLRATLQAALAEGVRACRSAAVAHRVDHVMRTRVTKQLGPGQVMLPRSGYGIGIGLAADWSEKETLRIDAASTDVLCDGATLHLIPWVQVDGVGAVGFSETVLVTPEGGQIL